MVLVNGNNFFFIYTINHNTFHSIYIKYKTMAYHGVSSIHNLILMSYKLDREFMYKRSINFQSKHINAFNYREFMERMNEKMKKLFSFVVFYPFFNWIILLILKMSYRTMLFFRIFLYVLKGFFNSFEWWNFVVLVILQHFKTRFFFKNLQKSKKCEPSMPTFEME